MAASKYLRIAVILLALFGVYRLGQKTIGFFRQKSTIRVPVTVLNSIYQNVSQLNKNLGVTINDDINSIRYRMYIDSIRVRPNKLKADTVALIIDSLVAEINNDINLLVKEGGGWAGGTDTAENARMLKDNFNSNVSTELMINQGRAAKLYKMIASSKTRLLNMIKSDPDLKKYYEEHLPISFIIKERNGVNESAWQEAYFRSVPLLAEIIFLNKLINDIRLSGSEMLNHYEVACYPSYCGFDTFVPRIIAPTGFVFKGEEYKAEIFLARYAFSIQPKVIIGPLKASLKKDMDGNYEQTKFNPVINGLAIPVELGIGKYFVKGASVGVNKYSGAIMVPGPDGVPQYYPFEAQYEVGERCK